MTFFRLDELEITDYKRLINSQEATKMHVFLQFAFNADTLREYLREEWMTVYDFQYIDDKIIGGVEKNLPAVADILKTVEKRATGKVSSALSIASSQMQESTTGALTESAMKQDTGFSHSHAGKDEIFSDGGED